MLTETIKAVKDALHNLEKAARLPDVRGGVTVAQLYALLEQGEEIEIKIGRNYGDEPRIKVVWWDRHHFHEFNTFRAAFDGIVDARETSTVEEVDAALEPAASA